MMMTVQGKHFQGEKKRIAVLNRSLFYARLVHHQRITTGPG